jgi:beta-lactamase regulating signal transducer with metallopeptidase domain
MTDLTRWFAPDTLRTLGWSLLHFVWQGFALAAVASVALTLFRRASSRYIVGVLTLVAMVASVAVTFVLLLNSDSALQSTEAAATPVVVFVQKTFSAHAAQSVLAGAPAVKSLSAQALPLLVEFWLAGVLFFTLRTAGGLIYLERLRRAASVSVAPALLAKCRELQSRLGLTRVIRFCECRWLDAPAVIGWFRPVVLLPFRALTGLTEDQIEAVIAHELAHIRRFDAFLNLFQVVVESLLFFHPAVWWLTKRVRIERENCCDDVAVAACGNHLGYARALTTMEEWRATPAFSLAANGVPLAARIARILGLRHVSESRTAGLGAGFACIGAAVIAGSLLWGVSHPVAASRVKEVFLSPFHEIVEKPTQALDQEPKPAPKPSAKASPTPEVNPSSQDAPPSSAQSSYIEGMKSVGIDTNDVDKLIALKIQGVTPEYVREIRAAGYSPSTDELLGLRIQGVTSDYIKQMKDAGFQLSLDHLMGMKIQGVTPAYVKEMRALGLQFDAEHIMGMKIQGVTPEYVKEIRDLGYKADPEHLMGLKIQGVTPEYVKQIRALGFEPNEEQIMGMKIQGVTPEYIKEMRDLGFKPNAEHLMGMKIQGVTPEYVKEMRSLGFELNEEKIMGMKIQGVSAEYAKSLAAEGYKLDADKLMAAKIMGITPEFIQKARSHGFKDLSLDKLIQLKNAEIF